MGYDLRNAALIACCVLAIVVAASLFPAAGYGDAPDRDAVDSEYYADSSDGILPIGIPDIDPGEFELGGERDERNDEEPEAEPEPSESDDDEVAGSSVQLSGNALAAVLIVSLVGMIGLSWRITDPTRSERYRERELPTGFVPNVKLRLRLIPQLTMAATIGAARVVPALADAAFRTAGDVGAGLGAIARGVGCGVGATFVAVPSALGTVVRGVGAPGSIIGGLSPLLSGVRRRGAAHPSSSGSSERVDTADGKPPDEPEFGPQSVEAAWEEMVETVAGRRDPTTTPAEYAGKAIEAGLPSSPVSTLTDAFREIRYGGYPPSPERTRRAREAAAAITAHRDESEGETE